jgi:uncharacterized protein involved in exopolysaccharide biosynthesis
VSEPQNTNIWLLFDVLTRRRGLLIGIVLVVTLASVIISLVLPSWYAAEVVLLPPKDIKMGAGSYSAVEEIASMTEGLTLPMMVTPSDLYARIFKSRRISEAIIDRFHLKERYQTGNRTDTYLALMSHVTFRVTDEGLLTVIVEDRVPDTAAAMANAYIEELDSLNNDIVGQRARQTRDFISTRLDQVKEELAASRKALEEFQRVNRTIDFDEQTRLAIDQATDLKISLAQVELELALRGQMFSKDNPELIEMRRKQGILKKQLQQLETGGGDSSYFSVPVAAIPALRGRYEDLYSRVRVNDRLYSILLEQNEQARISAQEEMPSVSVLDYARVPEMRSRPQRTRIVVGAFVASLLCGLLIVALVDYMARMAVTRPEDYDRFTNFVAAFFGWLPGVSRKKRTTGP